MPIRTLITTEFLSSLEACEETLEAPGTAVLDAEVAGPAELAEEVTVVISNLLLIGQRERYFDGIETERIPESSPIGARWSVEAEERLAVFGERDERKKTMRVD